MLVFIFYFGQLQTFTDNVQSFDINTTFTALWGFAYFRLDIIGFDPLLLLLLPNDDDCPMCPCHAVLRMNWRVGGKTWTV